jgi:hypothetical protein
MLTNIEGNQANGVHPKSESSLAKKILIHVEKLKPLGESVPG